jgi:uncharacterized membrane protein YgdD (TMEM256/DUF423 family)
LAALDGLMAVAAGAFGAHGVSDPGVKSFLATGAQYQMVHAVAALAGFALARELGAAATWAGRLFGLGGLLFGASLYALALGGARPLGAITPLGGLLMIAGWAALIYAAVRAARTGAP